jgi:catechol 2,3-dioxygenase-like lactoylglutathione lyase family enzyme
MKYRSLLILTISFGLIAFPALAQLAPPNATGVTMGHVHLFVKDVAAQQQFFTALGGTPVKNEKLEMVQFPGVFVVLRQADSVTGTPEGSVVNHFGFVWKDLPGMLAKWKAAGLKIEQEENPNQGYVHGPDGIRVEFFGDPSLNVPVLMNHIHFYTPEIPAMQAWYAKTFGGVAGTRARVSRPGIIDCVDVPGVNLSISSSKTKLAPTVGRSLDHIGFEVKNLTEFVKHLDALGIKLDEPMRGSPNSSKLHVTYITDPWGTRIEITEGLTP